ncbi:MAG: integrin alpha [Myxococcota bacterium]|jgi:hypothetical protein|nr:integrin alpha [Myxococcota bacterium]
MIRWMLVIVALSAVACGGKGDPIGSDDTGNSSGDDTGPEDTAPPDTGETTTEPLQSLADADAVLWGDAPGDYAGSGVVFAGDVTGDGHGDILVGVTADSEGGSAPGSAVLLAGPLEGEATLGEVGVVLAGSGTETAGLSLAGLGDVNGDEVDDFAVGAPYSAGAGVQRGAVYLFHGPVSTGGDLSEADGIVSGGMNYALAGWAIDGGEDIDGDGQPDLLVAAKWQGTASTPYAGTVYVLSDIPSGDTTVLDADHALQGEETEDVVGQSVALIDDVDGDGLADLLTGAVWLSPDDEREHAGGAYLVTSTTLATLDAGATSLEAATARLEGEDAEDLAGWDVSGTDVSGDGVGDLVISAPSHTEVEGVEQAGITYVVFGPVEGTVDLADADVRIIGDELLEWSGAAVSSAGDQDGDGIADLWMGSLYRSPGDSYIAGAALLFTGISSGDIALSDAAVTMAGAAEYDAAGWAVDGGEDIDGDGEPDLLVGASGADRDGSEDVGSVHLKLGPLVAR